MNNVLTGTNLKDKWLLVFFLDGRESDTSSAKSLMAAKRKGRTVTDRATNGFRLSPPSPGSWPDRSNWKHRSGTGTLCRDGLEQKSSGMHCGSTFAHVPVTDECSSHLLYGVALPLYSPRTKSSPSVSMWSIGSPSLIQPGEKRYNHHHWSRQNRRWSKTIAITISSKDGGIVLSGSAIVARKRVLFAVEMEHERLAARKGEAHF